MNLLTIDSIYRKWLTGKGALEFDKNSNETLVGLTYTESQTYLFFVAEMSYSTKLWTQTELEEVLVLYERHSFALEAIMMRSNGRLRGRST